MNAIQLVMEARKGDILVRAWRWPSSREVLRAHLTASPSHPRAAMELLEALARWQGQPVHAAVVADGPAGCSLGRLFPDLFEPEPTALVQVSFVAHRPGRAVAGCDRRPAPVLRQAELPFAAGGAR